MVKDHNVRLMLTNKSGLEMNYQGDWYDSGRLANTYSWPQSIPNTDECTHDILSYEKDWSLAGCSGYAQYEVGGVAVTFAFSNPVIGYNKLGVGTDGKNVWDNMGDHDYEPFVVQVTAGQQQLNVHCQCTGGTTNLATVTIYAAP